MAIVENFFLNQFFLKLAEDKEKQLSLFPEEQIGGPPELEELGDIEENLKEFQGTRFNERMSDYINNKDKNEQEKLQFAKTWPTRINNKFNRDIKSTLPKLDEKDISFEEKDPEDVINKSLMMRQIDHRLAPEHKEIKEFYNKYNLETFKNEYLQLYSELQKLTEEFNYYYSHAVKKSQNLSVPKLHGMTMAEMYKASVLYFEKAFYRTAAINFGKEVYNESKLSGPLLRFFNGKINFTKVEFSPLAFSAFNDVKVIKEFLQKAIDSYKKNIEIIEILKTQIPELIDNALKNPQVSSYFAFVDNQTEEFKAKCFAIILNSIKGFIALDDRYMDLDLESIKSKFSNLLQFSLGRESSSFSYESIVSETKLHISEKYHKILRNTLNSVKDFPINPQLAKYLLKESGLDINSIENFYNKKGPTVVNEIGNVIIDDNTGKPLLGTFDHSEFIIEFIKQLVKFISGLHVQNSKPYNKLVQVAVLQNKNIEKLFSSMEEILKIAASAICENELSRIMDNDRVLSNYSSIIRNTKSLGNKAEVTFLKQFNFEENFIGQLYKYINKNNIFDLYRLLDHYPIVVDFVYNFLKKKNRLNPEKFVKLVFDVTAYRAILNEVALHFGDTDGLINLLTDFVRTEQTIISDLELVNSINNMVHNNVSSDKFAEVFPILLKNKNVYQYNKFDFVTKIIDAVIEIIGAGGSENIEKTYEDIIPEATREGYISKNLVASIKQLEDLFKSGKILSVSLENFAEVKKMVSKISTDLTTLRTFNEIIDLLHNYEPKNKNLFNLNLQINDKLRFKVLKDKDPYHFQVGIDTDCCQRLGGAGQEAARDSFVNPLAGVLILEWLDGADWKILGQSYFHYVPKENGFILDNIESNDKNVEESDINLDEVYAWYAQEMKNKLKLSYFRCGIAYNKITNDLFEQSSFTEDPRTFHEIINNPYSDFDEGRHLDLTKSEIDVSKLNPEFWGNIKQSLLKLPNIFRKVALALLANNSPLKYGNLSRT